MSKKTFVVAQPFATPHRRFQPGDPIRPDDITGPVSFERWCALGVIQEELVDAQAATAVPSASANAGGSRSRSR